MMNIILVRHGKTCWNVENRYQGQKDVPLSEEGRRQAKLLARHLEGLKQAFPVNVIWSSDLSRALETARLIAEELQLAVIPHPGLREINFGVWEGHTADEVARLYPESYMAYHEDPLGTSPPGGESYKEVFRRVESALQDIIGNCNGGGGALIVAHGGSLKAAICSLVGIDPALRLRLLMDNTGISIVRYHKGMGSLLLYNDTCHLHHGAGR